MADEQNHIRRKLELMPVTVKGVSILIAILVAMFSGLQMIHSGFVLPVVFREVHRELLVELERHNIHPHPGAVSRNELDLIHDDIKGCFVAVNKQLDRIETRLVALEKS